MAAIVESVVGSEEIPVEGKTIEFESPLGSTNYWVKTNTGIGFSIEKSTDGFTVVPLEVIPVFEFEAIEYEI